MIEISNDYKERVIDGLINRFETKKEFGLTTKQFVNRYGVSDSIISRLKKGERGSLISDAKILNAGIELEITLSNQNWKTVETDVLLQIVEEGTFCKNFSTLRVMSDDCGIGKSHSGRYLCKTTANSFYVPCKRAKTRRQFIRALAKSIGLECSGTDYAIAERIIAILNSIPKPLIVLDDLGYVNNDSIMQVLDFIDATENACGWYVIGDDSLEERMERGIRGKKTGFRALFSRLNKRYSRAVPVERTQRIAFYKKLISDVIKANAPEGANIAQLVNQCLKSDSGELIGDIRRAKSLLILHSN